MSRRLPSRLRRNGFVFALLQRGVRATLARVGYDVVPLEKGLDALASRMLSAGFIDLVLDGGANVGQYMQHVQNLGFQGDIISVEPTTSAYSALAFIARHQAAKVTTVRAALGAQPGTSRIYVSANAVSSSLLNVRSEHVAAAPTSAVVGAEDVAVTTVDELIANSPARSILLKLDLQGSELDALRGSEASLSRVSAVQVELSLTALYDGQSSADQIFQHLRQRDFCLAHVRPGFEDPASGVLYQCDALFLSSRAMNWLRSHSFTRPE